MNEELRIAALEADLAALRADKQRLIQEVMDATSAAQDDHEYMAAEVARLEAERDAQCLRADDTLAMLWRANAENKTLRAQLDAAQTWTPVEDGEYGTIHIEDNGTWIAIDDRDSDGLKSYLGTEPPPNYAFCRRAAPPQEALGHA